MCTAATYKTGDFYMGRTLDYERSYGDRVVITPRSYPFRFRCREDMPSHYAMIGMAAVMEDYPLYYEAFNEKGLGICGLNFVGNACYFPEQKGKDNITQYELIPWILGQCETVAQAKVLLKNINLVNIPFLPNLPLAQLHWIMADQDSCITVESQADGLHVYDNPVGVLTNNPPFPYQMFNLDQQRGLCQLKENEFEITLYTCCCNASKGIYYYTTYDNHQITAVDMHRENLDGNQLVAYLPITEQQIRYQN